MVLPPQGSAWAQTVGESVTLDQADAEAAAEAAPPRRLGLFVAVERFDHPTFHPLKYPSADAEALAAAYSADGLAAPEDVVVISRREGPVTRTRILAALDALQQRNTRRDDVGFVAFSSHGTLGRADDGSVRQVLVTEDTAPLDQVHATGIPVDELLARMARFRSRRRVTLVAACNSGVGMSDGVRLEWERSKGAAPSPVVLASESTVTLFAAGPRQVAVEDAALGHDVYVHYFLQALEDGDLDRDGAVTVTEAHWSAAAKTFEHTQGNQLPQIKIDATGLDPIYLRNTPTRTGVPVIWSYDPQEAWLTLRVDGEIKGRFPGPIAVPPGAHRLSLSSRPDAQPFTSVDVAVRPGERLSLDSVFAPVWAVGVRGGVRRPVGVVGEHLGGTTPGGALTVRRTDPAWSGWGLDLELSVQASDQEAPGGQRFRRGSASALVGVERLLASAHPVGLIAGVALGAGAVERDFDPQAPERGWGPAGAAKLLLRAGLGECVDLELGAHSTALLRPTEQRGLSVFPEVGVSAGLAYRWRSTTRPWQAE